MLIKYPRTPHFAFSPGTSNDDRVLESLDGFEGKQVVITEKMDGENTTLYDNCWHARSLDSKSHPSRTWLQGFHSCIQHKIPVGWRICGENLYAKHSIPYINLESYFLGFSIWNEYNIALSWEETIYFFREMGIVPVPVLYTGTFDLKLILSMVCDMDITKMEGIVVRITDRINYSDFNKYVAKWVRPGHVESDGHWMYSKIHKNILKQGSTKCG